MTILNIIFLTIIFFWAFYHTHVAERAIKRVAYALIGLASTLVIIAYFAPENSVLYYRNHAWQRFFYNGCLAFFCVADFYCESGTARFKTAFINSKNKIFERIDLTRS